MDIPASTPVVPWQALVGDQLGDVALLIRGAGRRPVADASLVVLPRPPTATGPLRPGRMALRRRDIDGNELLLLLSEDADGFAAYVARRPDIIIVETTAVRGVVGDPYVATVEVILKPNLQPQVTVGSQYCRHAKAPGGLRRRWKIFSFFFVATGFHSAETDATFVL